MEIIFTEFYFAYSLAECHKKVATVRHRPEQKRVTWETPSSEAIPLLQEPVGVLASYAPHEQMQV
jgi:hypothetical protein